MSIGRLSLERTFNRTSMEAIGRLLRNVTHDTPDLANIGREQESSMLRTLAVSTLVFALCCALPAQAQPEVASTSKSVRQMRTEFWDGAKKQPKLLQEFYIEKKFDRDGKQIGAAEEVKDGYWVEWSKSGKYKTGNLEISGRVYRGEDWYLKLVERYEAGVRSEAITFFDNGSIRRHEWFSDGALNAYCEWLDADAKVGGGFVKVEERGVANPIPWRTEYEYHADGRVKRRSVREPSWPKDGVAQVASITVLTESAEGLRTLTINDVKREEGMVSYRTLIESKYFLKEGEWKYWDDAGKLTKTETYEAGVLKETREYK